jgi:hypothetical protein
MNQEIKKTVSQSLINLLLTGVLLFLFQTYCTNKLIRDQQKEHDFMTSKKDAYSYAIEIAYKQIASMDYDKNALTGNPLPPMKRNKGTLPPTELEINTAYSRLYLYAGDTSVLNAYYKIMVNNTGNYTPNDYLKEFLDAITTDLGNSDAVNKNLNIPYIVADTSHKKIYLN